MPDSIVIPAEPTVLQSPPQAEKPVVESLRPAEVGGRTPRVSNGLEPTRYGDWEKDGRCIDF